MSNLTTSADIDGFMAASDNAAARTALGAGDMTKSVYDSQNANHISGTMNGGAAAGVLNMDAPGSGLSTGASITTTGGNAAGSDGGAINTSGGGTGGASGGGVNTSGATLPGGSIDTHDGGGSINTRGTGSIQLGAAGTRTTINGAAGSDITLTLPVLTSVLWPGRVGSGWVSNGDGGDNGAVIPDEATIAGMAAALNLLVPGFGDAFSAVASKTKALQFSLGDSAGVNPLYPNAP